MQTETSNTSVIAYPQKRWRRDTDMHRLIGSGDGAIPAVIAACGASSEKPGQFWWGVGEIRGYEPTIEAAKQSAEARAVARELGPKAA